MTPITRRQFLKFAASAAVAAVVGVRAVSA
jgi:hypothetical protein